MFVHSHVNSHGEVEFEFDFHLPVVVHLLYNTSVLTSFFFSFLFLCSNYINCMIRWTFEIIFCNYEFSFICQQKLLFHLFLFFLMALSIHVSFSSVIICTKAYTGSVLSHINDPNQTTNLLRWQIIIVAILLLNWSISNITFIMYQSQYVLKIVQ